MKTNIATVLFALLIASCNNGDSKTHEESAVPLSVSTTVDTTHSSRNSLDWKGVYTGVALSGNDSSQTVIQLNSNNTYITETTVKGKGKPVETKGDVKWAKDGNTLTIDHAQYKVTEGALVALDSAGATTAIAFKKIEDPLLEKYWKLIELNGKVLDSTQQNKEPHIIFRSFDNRFNGNGGCNNFSGTYTLLPNGRIKLSKVVSTQMACPAGMDTESVLHGVLGKIDTYIISGDTLTITKARMAPLAKFQVVYLH